MAEQVQAQDNTGVCSACALYHSSGLKFYVFSVEHIHGPVYPVEREPYFLYLSVQIQTPKTMKGSCAKDGFISNLLHSQVEEVPLDRYL